MLQIAPENLEVANAYLATNSIPETAQELGLTYEYVASALETPEIRRYIDAIYLDRGYRNKHKLGDLMDQILESKLEECVASEMYSSKDLADLLQMAHKMRMEEAKLQQTGPTHQTNVQINEAPFGGGNYGELMKKLLD